MRHDKKARDGGIRLVLNHGIGTVAMHEVEAPLELLQYLLP